MRKKLRNLVSVLGLFTATAACWLCIPSLAMAQPGDEGAASAANAEPAMKEKNVDKWEDPETTRIYVIPFRGEFGRDFSQTPMKRAMAEAKKEKPDIILLVFDASYTIDGETYDDYAQFQGQASWNAVFRAAELATIFNDDFRSDKEFVNRKGEKPRIIGWVKKAMGPSAFLCLAMSELYFAENARVGGVGYLNFLFAGRGDEVVREKQRSLRMGKFEGLMSAAGYPTRIARAMSRSDGLLSYSMRGGKPVFFEDLTGDNILMDGGDPDRRDTMEDLVRLRGNDVLTLNATTARDLGISRGTVNSEDELVSTLGVERSYAVRGEKALRILSQWSREISSAEGRVLRNIREFQRIQINGRTPAERNAQRGRQLGILNNVKRDLEKYEEAISPDTIQGAPKEITSEINVIIERIKTEMRLDK
jgi:hypothetical protein